MAEQTWYQRVIAAHTAVTQNVSHAIRMKSERYFVWEEDGENALAASDGHAERVVTGHSDLYTKTEFDTWVDALGESLSSAGIAWSYVGCEYEEETGFWHHSWDWEAW